MCFLAHSLPRTHTQREAGAKVIFRGREQLENGVYKNQGLPFGGHTTVLKQRCLWLKGEGVPLIFPALMFAPLPL